MNRFRKNANLLILLLAPLLLIPFSYSMFVSKVSAFGCVSNGTGGGPFNVPSTWTSCNGVTPLLTDTITISSGDTVTLVATTTVAGVTINNGGVLDANTRSLIDTGPYTNNGSQTGTTATMTLSGLAGTIIDGTGSYAPTGVVTISVGSKTVASTATLSFDKITVTGVTLTNNSTGGLTVVTALSGTGGVTQGSSALLNIGTASAITTLTATASGNTVTYNGAGNQTIKGTTYENLKINKSAGIGTLGADTIVQSTGTLNVLLGTMNLSTVNFTNNSTLASSTSVTGTLNDSSVTGTNIFAGPITINSGGSWTSTGNSAYTIRNGIAFNGTTFTSGTGTYTFDTNAQAISGTTAISISNVTVTGITLTNNSTIGFSIPTTIAGTGELKQGTSALLKIGAVAANFTITTFTATASGNTVTYNGALAQTLRGTTYENLNINGVAIVSNSDAATVIQSTGSVTVPTGTLNLSSKDFTNNSTTSVTGTISDDSATGTNTFIGLAIVNAAGIWTSAGNSAYTFRGGLTFNGATFTSGSGIYTFDTNAQNIAGLSAYTIQNVTVTGINLTNLDTVGLTVGTDLTGTGTFTQGTNATLSLGGTSGITTLTATAAGNTVKYISTTAGQTIKDIVYVNLTIDKTAQTATLANTSTVNGNLNVISGVLADAGFTMSVKGNGTMTGSETGAGKILFTGGAAVHTVVGVGSYNNVELDDANGASQSGTVNIGGTFTVTSGSWTPNGNTLTVTGNTSVSGTISIVSTAGTKTFGNITINNGGLITFSALELVTVNGNLVINGTGAVTGTSGAWTFQRVGGGTISGTASSVSITSTTFTTSYVLSIPANFPTVTVTGAAVVLTNNTTLTINTALTGTGQLTQGAGTVLNLGGTVSVTTLDASVNSNEVHYTSTTANQTMKAANYYNLFVDKAGRTANAAGGTTNVLGNLNVTAGTISLVSSFFTVTGTTDIHGTLTDLNNTGVGSFGGLVTVFAGGGWDGIGAEACDFNFSNGFLFNGSSFVRGGGTYTFLNNNQSISGSGAMNITTLVVTGIQLNNANSSVVTLTNSLTGTGTFVQNSGSTLTLSGTNTVSTFDASASGNTVNYNGAAAQTVKSGTYSTLTVNGNTNSNVNNIANVTVNTLLTLGTTIFSTGVNRVIMAPGGTLSRTSGYIDGNLEKNFAIGSTSNTFEVGSNGSYAPVDITFGNVSVAGDFIVATITGEHPNVATSGFTTNRTINRYWTTVNNGITFTNYNATFNFVAGDLDPLTDTSKLVLKKFDSGTWTKPTVGTSSLTSVQGTSIGTTGGFIIGNSPISDVSSTLPNGSYTVGQIVPIQVTFSDNAFVTGVPQISLNSGGTADYVSGSGTTTLTFNYVVGSGENSSDLDYTSTTALTLNGGTIQDVTLADLDLTLPSPGTAGSLGFNKNIIIDTTVPVFSAVTPVTGSSINSVTASSDVAYILSENVSTATITITRTGGTADPSSPHVCNLSGTALTSGSHSVDFSDTVNGCNPAVSLVDRTIYTFAFNAVDVAGNSATTVTSTNVTFDDVAPAFSAVTPVTGSSINSVTTSSDVAYILSEDVSSATITLIRTGGTADPSSPFACNLTGTALASGGHSIDFSDTVNGCNPAENLVNGAIYTFVFDAVDAAGNIASTVMSTNVTFDNVAPVLSAVTPTTGSTINSVTTSSDVAYILDENSSTATITITRTGGTADPSSPHICNLTGTALTSGGHSIDFSDTVNGCNPAVSLVSGTIYTFTFDATDMAGNSATTVTSTNVTFDNVPPVISAATPTTGSTINSVTTSSDVGYTLSEDVSTATITITRTGGAADPSSPFICNLSGTSLTSGGHTIDFSDTVNGCNPAENLVNGAIYTFLFNAEDSAGNIATTVTSTNVTFDNVAPVLSAVTPTTGSTINNVTTSSHVGYTLDEDVVTATITVTRTGGTADPTSPHVCNLTGTALTVGTHTINFTDTINGCNPAVALVDGTVYTFTFDANDVAGNAASTVTSTNVTYDSTAPSVLAVNTTHLDGIFKAGEIIDLTVQYSQAVTVAGGVPQLSLNSGGIATYLSGSGTTTLTFRYTVGPTENSADLDYDSIGALTLNGATIKNVSNTNADNTLPVVGTFAAAHAIIIDTTIPTFTAVTPTTGSSINSVTTSSDVAYTLNEDVSIATITITRTGGTADPSSPYTCNLSGTSLLSGTHTIDFSDIVNGCNPAENLVNGAIYTFAFDATDMAGNISITLSSTNVTFDTTPLVISNVTPVTGSSVNTVTVDSDVSYTLNENASAATITVTRTGGTADPSSPYTCNLSGTALTAGTHTINFSDTTNGCNPAIGLVNGAVYSFAFNATDLAGNIATAITSTDVTFVTTLPAAPTTSLTPGTYTSSQIITLTSGASTSIRFTLDGSDLTCLTGNLYTDPISVTSTVTIKAIACDNAGNASTIQKYLYTIQAPGQSFVQVLPPTAQTAPVAAPALFDVITNAAQAVGSSSILPVICIGLLSGSLIALGVLVLRRRNFKERLLKSKKKRHQNSKN